MITLTAATAVIESGLATLASNEGWAAGNQPVNLTPVSSDNVEESMCPIHFLNLAHQEAERSGDLRANYPASVSATFEYRAFMVKALADAHLKRTLDAFVEKFKNRIRAISITSPHPGFTVETEFIQPSISEGQSVGMIFAFVVVRNYKWAEDE